MREDVEIRIDEKEHEGYLEVIKSTHGVLIKEFNEFAHEHGRACWQAVHIRVTEALV